MSTSNYATGPAPGEYSVDVENQLEPEDTLVDRGGADLLDDPGAFMAEDGGGRDGLARLEDKIGVAEADANHAHENLVLARLVDLQFLDAEISLGRTRDRSRYLHRPPP